MKVEEPDDRQWEDVAGEEYRQDEGDGETWTGPVGVAGGVVEFGDAVDLQLVDDQPGTEEGGWKDPDGSDEEGSGPGRHLASFRVEYRHVPVPDIGHAAFKECAI